MWILLSARLSVLSAVLNLFLETVSFPVVKARSGSRQIMPQRCDKIVVILPGACPHPHNPTPPTSTAILQLLLPGG